MSNFEIILDKALRDNIVDHYPHPISYRFLLAVNAGENQEKLQGLLDLYAAVVRYCAVIAISDYLRSDLLNPAVNIGILELMDRSSVTQWEGLCREIAQTFVRISQSMFVDELKRFYLLPNEQLSAYGFSLKSWLNFFTQAKRAYGIDRVPPELFCTRLSELEELLKGLAFLTEYRLVQILACSISGSGMCRFTVKEWMGVDPPVESVQIVGACIEEQLRKENPAVLALYHADRNKLLSLYPFLICDLSKLPSPKGIEEELFFFNGRQANSVSYYSAIHGLDGARVTGRYLSDLDSLISRCIIGGPDTSVSWQASAQVAFQGQTRTILDDIRQTEYEASVYLHRGRVETAVKEFLADDRYIGFLLIGDSGTGKTNLLAHVAEDRIRQGDIVLLRAFGNSRDKPR